MELLFYVTLIGFFFYFSLKFIFFREKFKTKQMKKNLTFIENKSPAINRGYGMGRYKN